MIRVEPARLAAAIAWLLGQAGCAPDIAREVAENLVDADLCGHGSHGCRLVGAHVVRLRDGTLSGTARPELVSAAGPILRIDGRRAFGQIVGAFAAAQGIAAAKRHGVAVVAATGAGHFGRNGKWPELAAEAGLASIHFVNGPAAPSSIVPFGARDARLTSNPIALGAPHPAGEHVILDFSVGEVSVNTIKQAYERGERLPTPCIVAADGTPTDDPAVFLTSSRAMTVFGGYKGYGLGVFTEIFAGAPTGGGCHVDDSGGAITNNLLSIYLDVAAFSSPEAYGAEIERFAAWIAAARPAAESGAAALPGRRSREAHDRHDRAGLTLAPGLLDVIRAAAERLGVAGDLGQGWPDLFDPPQLRRE